MRKILTILFFVPLMSNAQDIERAIDSKVSSTVDKKVNEFIKVVGWDTTKVRNFTSASNVDTLKTANNTTSIFEIVVTGNINCVRYYAVKNKAGVYTVSVSEFATFPLPTGVKFISTVVSSGVILQTSGTTG